MAGYKGSRGGEERGGEVRRENKKEGGEEEYLQYSDLCLPKRD